LVRFLRLATIFGYGALRRFTLMAEIFPFRAWHYDTSKVSLADVLTQPYDKITPAMQDRYYAASPFNLIAVEKGKPSPSDNGTENVYSRAAGKLDEWIRTGILQQDSTPSIYVYAQEFALPGSKDRQFRRGFIALGRLEDYAAGVVFRHEKTLSAPKADRLELLSRTRTQTGQLFMLYDDSFGEIEPLMAEAQRGPAAIDFQDEYGVRHQIWLVSDPAAVARFVAGMAKKKIVIADGHHRYETALAYRDACRARAGRIDLSAPYEKAMMTFFNDAAPGLVILATHRVLGNLRDFDATQFRECLRRWFVEMQFSFNSASERITSHENFRRELQARRSEHVIGVYTGDGAFSLFRLRPDVSLNDGLLERLFNGLSAAQRELDVVLLHRLIIGECLGITPEAVVRESYITYEREMDAAIAAVDAGKAQLACLLNPVGVTQVAEMALAGDVLPQKSTDFYPKLLSGLAIYRLDGGVEK
jgi:uncharacterized protein (DUF1015 family)